MKRVALAALLSLAPLVGACGGGSQGPKAAAQTGLAPANPQAVEKMVQGVTAARDPALRDRGIALLKEAILIDRNLWEARYDLGVVLANAGDLAGADAELKAAEKLAPDAPEVVFALAEVERRRGEHKEAAEALGDFLATHPTSVEARTLYVQALRASGQVEKAIGQARELLVKKPGDASALSELALCHLAKGEKDTATLLAKQAVDADAKSAPAQRAMGLVLLANGDDALAFQAFAKATQEDPRDTTARLNMGGVLLRAGAYAKAEEQYRATLSVSAEDSDAEVGLAAALRGEGKHEEARGILEKALAKDPHQTSALFNLSVLYIDFLKRPEAARPLLVRFLDEAPQGHPARPDAERYLKNLGPAPAPAAPAGAPAPGGATPQGAAAKPKPAGGK